MKRLFICGGIALVCFLIWRKAARPVTQITGRAMGCDWKLICSEALEDPRATRAEIARVLEHWEQVMSTWRRDSDLSRYNRGEPATADLLRVLELAEQMRLVTGGAFDHRMLAELGAAGFGPGGTGVDLSSLGKGFAVDRVAEGLRRRGIRRYAFSLAGEVRVGEGTWPVGIELPEPGARTVVETIELTNLAMASSGNARQWNGREGGLLKGHILDPATRKPVLRPPCSVTVIGQEAAVASAWATALFVLGPSGNACAEARGLRVIWHGLPSL